MRYTGKVELANERKIRTSNTGLYRAAHWPIWIWVFFLAPGPLTFSLFAHGMHCGNLIWLAVVLVATGIAAICGSLPGAEQLLNLTGLIVAVATGTWYLKQIYHSAYGPICLVILVLGALGKLPRVGRSTLGEGTERRYFYGSVWAVTIGQAVLMLLWKLLPHTRTADLIKLLVFIAVLALVGLASYNGKLPRTRPILPGASIVAD